MEKPWSNRHRRHRLGEIRAEQKKRRIVAEHSGRHISPMYEKDGHVVNWYYGDRKYLKRKSNKSVRKKLDVGSGNEYRRHTDYSWQLI